MEEYNFFNMEQILDFLGIKYDFENKENKKYPFDDKPSNIIFSWGYITVERKGIEKEIKYHEKNILDIENITMLKSKTVKEEAEIEFNKYAIVVLKKMLRELIEESDKKIKRVEKSTRIERLL